MKKNLSPDTRLKKALDLDPRVVDYVVSLNPRDFERLRNPLMRRLMAPRITLGRVATMARVPVAELLDHIGALGDVAVEYKERHQLPQSPQEPSPWLTTLETGEARTIDLLPLDDELAGDPMLPVTKGVQSLSLGETLLIKHRWEPQPLYDVWHKTGGIEWFSKQIREDEWWIWVHRITKEPRLAK
ncbi:hypothetical protein BH24ACT22_BH24ACT22_07150 [soil metagenome]